MIVSSTLRWILLPGAVILFLLSGLDPVLSAELTVIMTSNLEGRVSTREINEDDDFFLKLGQSILAEKRRSGADVYVDLGNAFYPGPLSRYSFGSVMMDFLESMECSATLISSRDLRIGIDNLEFIKSDKRTVLLSANII